MTTIILTVLGVLFTAVVALMIFFYGGEIFGNASTRADAARLVSEGAQMEHAVALYQVQEGTLPGLRDKDGNLIATGAEQTEAAKRDLMTRQYMPIIPKGAQDNWKVDYTKGIIKTTVGPASDKRNRDVCVEARRQLNFTNPEDVKACDDPNLNSREPCCIDG